MRKLLLFMMLFGTLFTLTSCDIVDAPIEESTKYHVIYYTEEDQVYYVKSYEEGTHIVEPDSPLKENFIFEYWTLNSDQYLFDTEISEDINLIAKWLEEAVEVPLYDVILYNGLTIIDEIQVDPNTALTEIDNYPIVGSDAVFVGWYLDSNLTIEFDTSTTISSDVSLYGKWEIEDDIDPINTIEVSEDGLYTSRDEVALYIATFHKLPSNYMTKAEAGDHISNLWTSTNKASIGGDVFGNREGLLPYKAGRTFIELDIDYNGGSRGAKRIVYSSDFRIFYTFDHYESFVEYDKETREWKSY